MSKITELTAAEEEGLELEFAQEIQTQPKTDMEEYYQDGLSVQAVALGISMNLL